MAPRRIEIQTHFGIGDALFLTPTLRRIKEAYVESLIRINTRHPVLFENNPYVDVISDVKRGTRLMYCDPTSCTGKPGKRPKCHHIEADWGIVAAAYGLRLKPPDLKPEVYFDYIRGAGRNDIGVQVIHKGLWHDKKNWGKFDELANRRGFRPIPLLRKMDDARALAEFLTDCRAIVCAEGGISHLCRALDVPCVVVYGGFADPRWNGYPEQVNITTSIKCGPCYSGDPCPMNPPKECMRMISVEAMIHQALWTAERRR